MSTLYGLYLIEAWKPRVMEEPLITEQPPRQKMVAQKKKEVGRQNAESHSSRRLRVQGKINSSLKSETSFPEIKLSGQWLKQLGFVAGQQVRVTTEHQKITIELDDTG